MFVMKVLKAKNRFFITRERRLATDTNSSLIVWEIRFAYLRHVTESLEF